MRRMCGRQGDLFEERAAVLDLDLELRTKLTPLLQALLTEAARGGPETSASCDAEGSDDTDHA